MKRHPALHPLSHQHRDALSVALSLRRAGTAEARVSSTQAARAFLRFWAEDGRDHLRLEEEVLLPYSAGYLDLEDERIAVLLRQHVRLRALARQLQQAVNALGEGDAGSGEEPLDLALLQRLGDLLERHVRHEERQVFPMIEEQVPDEVLEGINQALPQDTGLDR